MQNMLYVSLSMVMLDIEEHLENFGFIDIFQYGKLNSIYEKSSSDSANIT